ncbi:MAG: hypothetical protein CSA20_04915 [Deltaproteobacteria bacterium]|nr:MAG: hypothetical protein CSA20_04915 [Deltaproteobacteria bacterium]
MLQILRRKAQSPLIQFVVVVIVLVFVFWGVGSNLSGNRQAALTVNDEVISFHEFQKAYDQTYENYSRQFGDSFNKELAEALGIKQQTIRRLIQASLLRQGAREMGIHVGASTIRQTIEAMAQFQKDGIFDMGIYKELLARIGKTPTQFEKSMRQDALLQLGERDIGSFASTATQIEIDEIYGLINETAVADYVVFEPSDYLDSVTVQEDDLAQWFTTVQDNYQSKPQVKIEYLSFLFEDVAKRIEIDPAQVQNYYQENQQLFAVPERREAAHIVFKASAEDPEAVHRQQAEKAAEVLAQARAGKDFSELAKLYSEAPGKENGGQLGFISRGQTDLPGFEEALFNMQNGDISDVVKTRLGYHIIQLKNIVPASQKSLEDSEETIVATLQKKEAANLTFQLANQAYEGIISAGSLDKYLQENPQASIQTSPFFDRDNPPPALEQDPVFVEKIFALNKGDLSSLIKGGTGYAIFLIKDTRAPQPADFEKIKEKLATDYKAAKASEMAEKAAKELIEQAKSEGLPAAAQTGNYTLKQSGKLMHNRQDSGGFPASLREEVFLLTPQTPLASEPGQAGGAYYVYSLAEKTIPAMPTESQERDDYRARIIGLKQQQLLSAWLRHQESKAKITKHPSL